MTIRLLALALAALVTVIGGPARAQLSTIRVASGLLYPVYVTAPPGDVRLFIVEQRGRIKILKDGAVLPTPFLDIDALIPDIMGNDERGLLGLCFAPDYATSGNFYVHYNNLASDTIVRRYTVSANPDVANAASAFDIFFQDQPFNNHNGGSIEFGPDGYLYIGLGDGGSSNDPNNNGQNGATLLGKFLRIDPTGDDFPADAAQNYSIPPTNPFVANPSFRDEIWHYGVRNPYRWSFDRATGDLWIGEVGQNCFEEVDFQPASSPGGLNYGWRIMEGEHCFQIGTCSATGCNTSGLTFPVLDYPHTQDGFSCSVTGGYVYRGSAIPWLSGTYFYADFCSNQIRSLRYVGGVVTEHTNRTAELTPPVGSIASIAAIGEDGAGELYFVERSATAGEIYKLIPDPDFVGVDIPGNGTTTLQLARPQPNPFESATTLRVTMPKRGTLRLALHDAAGRLVRSLFAGRIGAGTRSFVWDGMDDAGRPANAGVYFARAESEGHLATQRLVRLR